MPAFSFCPGDGPFHYGTLRQLSLATAHGSDLAEVLRLMPIIKAGDFDWWAEAWHGLAVRVEARSVGGVTCSGDNEASRPSRYSLTAQAKQCDPSTACGKFSKRSALFRASTYYRVADFFLHNQPEDPRIMQYWEEQARAFDQAVALLPIPGQRVNTKTPHGFTVPAIFFRAQGSGLAPTLIIGNGYDSSSKEMLHALGFATLERGFNAIVYEGPGMPSVRRYQGLGFIPEWEKVATPVADYLTENASQLNIDASKLGLVGYSLGGFLGLRAVAFEKTTLTLTPTLAMPDDHEKADAFISDAKRPTALKSALTHGLWAMLDESQHKDAEGHLKLKKPISRMDDFTAAPIVDKVECECLTGDAEDDIFFKGQPERVVKALGNEAKLHLFKPGDGAGANCQSGAYTLLAQVILDWFEKVVQ